MSTTPLTVTLPPKLAEAIRWQAANEGADPVRYILEGLAERISSELVEDRRTLPGLSQTALERDLLDGGDGLPVEGVN